MDSDKIEVLVEKIDQAIRIIENLKEENNNYATKLADAEKKSTELEKEIKKLKDINEKQNSEIEKNEKLHKRLEDKIQLILKYLPDENVQKKSKKEHKHEESSTVIDKEESPKIEHEQKAKKEKKELFPEIMAVESEVKNEEVSPLRAEYNKGIAKKSDIAQESADESDEGSVDIKYGDSLLSREEEGEVNFYLDEDEDEKDELPKGVL